jgi:hypothetical protein
MRDGRTPRWPSGGACHQPARVRASKHGYVRRRGPRLRPVQNPPSASVLGHKRSPLPDCGDPALHSQRADGLGCRQVTDALLPTSSLALGICSPGSPSPASSRSCNVAASCWHVHREAVCSPGRNRGGMRLDSGPTRDLGPWRRHHGQVSMSAGCHFLPVEGSLPCLLRVCI